MNDLEDLNNEQIKELLNRDFRFKHKTLEEYIAENNAGYPRIDYPTRRQR